MSETASDAASQEAPAPPEPFLERLSDALQNGVKVVVGSNRKPPRLLKTLLNGTFLGHPLHPVLTDIPIGSWTIAVIFDIIWLISPGGNTWAARAAFVAVIVGLLGALGSAATGLTDWSDTFGSERRVGLYHALLNISATILYLVSFIVRLTANASSNESAAGAIIGFIGYALIIWAAYFGGDMVFTKGTGVNHTAWEAGSEDYEAVLPVADVEEHKLYRVTAAGVPVVLMRMGEQFYAISATCTHAGGPLDEGTLTGDIVECPWHGSRFCMRDGHVHTGPATAREPRYDVRVREGQIEVKRAGDH